MNKLQLLLLNMLLACAAVLATAGLVRSHEHQRSMPKAPAEDGDAQLIAPRVRNRLNRPARLGDVSEGLWQNNLFNPQRGPIVEAPGEKQDETAMPSAELELTGIGRIGKRQAAIIIVKSAPVRRIRNLRDRRQRGRPQAETGIYAVDDEIGDTGYRLKEINFDKQAGVREVSLVDADGQTRVLSMETDDPASQARSESAAAEAPKQVATIKTPAQPPRDASAPPPPPPVAGQPGDGAPAPPPKAPVIPAGASDDQETPDKPVAEMTREERLKWAIEMRRRHMRNRQNDSNRE